MADSFATRAQLAVNGKSFTYSSLPKLGERFNFEYRAEIFDLTNHQNFNTPVSATNRNVTSSTGTNFLNYSVLNGGSRTMRMGVKLIF